MPTDGRRASKLSSLSKDVVPGITNGVANIPDAMANALLAGASPITGLYALLAGTPAAALTTSSQFMTVAVTAAMAVTVGAGIEQFSLDKRDAAISTMALMVGAFMILLGILRGGRLLRYVSNAVMKGFLNGVAVLVVVGQLGNVTGYDGQGQTKLASAFDTARHVAMWEPAAVATTLVTVVLILALSRTRLRDFAMLLALVSVSAGVALLHVAVPLVGSVSQIPLGLPAPRMPSVELLPPLIIPALSVALIGVIQGGGISKAFPNPDGAYPDPSRDMVGQGIGNAASAVFGGMPIGASVSSTAMVATSGARSRLANVLMGVVIAAVLLVLGPLVESVPLSVLGGILIVVGFSAFDLAGMRDVWAASRQAAVIMGLTLGAMLLIPVQYAVLMGAVLSGAQYVHSASRDIRVVALVRVGDGRWSEQAPPEVLPSDAVTVVDIYGSMFYAGVELVDALLPSVAGSVRPCLVVRLRGHSELGSTAIGMLRRYHGQIEAAGGRLILAGVEMDLMKRLALTGFVDELGAENVLPKSDIVYAATEAAVAAGEAWLGQRRGEAR